MSVLEVGDARVKVRGCKYKGKLVRRACASRLLPVSDGLVLLIRIASYSRSDRSGESISHAFDLCIFHPRVSLASIPRLSTLAHRLLNHRCTTPADKSHSFPPPQPPAFPFSFCLLTFPSYFGQRRSTLSRSRTALVRPQYIP